MALIPIDVALGGINSIRGLFGANEADRERRRQIEEAARQRRMAIDMLAKRSQDAFDAFQRWEQSFNPQATLNQIGQASAENLGNVLKNLNVGPMGEYRKDDTPRVMAARIATTEGLLKEQAARLAAQQQFENERYARLSDVNQRRFEEAQFRGNLGGQMQEEGMRMPANNLQTYLGNLVSMMPKQEKKTSTAGTATTAKDLGYNPIPQLGYQGQTGIQLSGLTDINKAFSKKY